MQLVEGPDQEANLGLDLVDRILSVPQRRMVVAFLLVDGAHIELCQSRFIFDQAILRHRHATRGHNLRGWITLFVRQQLLLLLEKQCSLQVCLSFGNLPISLVAAADIVESESDQLVDARSEVISLDQLAMVSHGFEHRDDEVEKLNWPLPGLARVHQLNTVLIVGLCIAQTLIYKFSSTLLPRLIHILEVLHLYCLVFFDFLNFELDF